MAIYGAVAILIPVIGFVVSPVRALEQEACPARPITDGGVLLYVYRMLDDVCIGSISWAVVPNPSARIRLFAGWCGRDACGPAEGRTGKGDWQTFPTRFWEGRTNWPSIRLRFSNQSADGPGALSHGDERVVIRIADASEPVADVDLASNNKRPNGRGQILKMAQLEAPLGVYAFVPDQKNLKRIGNRGDNLCLTEPMVFAGRGRILMKRIGKPRKGNPYSIERFMDCSSFHGGPEVCEMFEGAPEAGKTPAAAGAPNTYRPLGQGDFEVCPRDVNRCGLLYACVREGGAIAFDRQLADGGSLVDAMLDPGDGSKPLYRYIDNQTLERVEP